MSDSYTAVELDHFIESSTQITRELSTERSDWNERPPVVEMGTPPLSWPDSYIVSNTQIARELNIVNQVRVGIFGKHQKER